MIYKKAKQLLGEFRQGRDDIKAQHEQLRLQLAELEWANIFHDTIKDREWLRETAISPGRWAGNYSFFYLLVRILADYKPQKILEFGLGKSSKIISTFLQHELTQSNHLMIEQDKAWIDGFNDRFKLGDRSRVLHFPLTSKNIQEFEVTQYDGLETSIKETFDFYLVDGLFGSERYSRYQICALAEHLKTDSEFVILLDDYNRKGERDTAKALLALLKAKGIEVFTGEYFGSKGQLVITSPKYKYATSI